MPKNFERKDDYFEYLGLRPNANVYVIAISRRKNQVISSKRSL